jgi:glutamyl-tRNA reductase
LFDLDQVFERVSAAKDARAGQAPLAEAIVSEQAEAFGLWLRSRENVEVLRAVREQVLLVARREADRFAQGRSEGEREQMRRLARSVARTLLHAPSVALRAVDPNSAEGRAVLKHAPALFGVKPGSLDASEPG